MTLTLPKDDADRRAGAAPPAPAVGRRATGGLAVVFGQCSDKGRKPANQDFHGAIEPAGEALALKGIAVAIADGISSSDVGHIAAQSAIKAFLTDYYCTSEAWSVKTSASRVIAATNSWLHAQNGRSGARHDPDRGQVTTFTAIVFKSTTAHIFHVGDARVWQIENERVRQLTRDHRVVVSQDESYLGRALGVKQDVEIDYETVSLREGDIFVLTTDGVHDHIAPEAMAATIRANPSDLDGAARQIVDAAIANGSTDNLTIQIVRIVSLADREPAELGEEAAHLSPPPLLEAGDTIDGYRVLRSLHASSRSHVYLAEDIATGTQVALKILSIDLRSDIAYLKRFLMEEWVARRIQSAHVLSVPERRRPRQSLYTVMEFIDGTSLAQWMFDNPRPDIDTVRGIIGQIAKGLRAFHRLEMVHQDVRPENILIDRCGTVKIIDFGSVKIAGVMEGAAGHAHGDILGTPQFTAPECILGEPATSRSDLYALGVIVYQMLTGQLPYGARLAQARTRLQQSRAAYQPVTSVNPDIAPWIDAAIRRAVLPDPAKRQHDVFEFVHAVEVPPEGVARGATAPLIERNPVLLWQIISGVLAAIILIQALWR